MIADWFHCGYFLDEGNDRTSARQVMPLLCTMPRRSSKARVECPTV